MNTVKYPFAKMKVGETYTLPGNHPSYDMRRISQNLCSAAHAHGRKYNKCFTVEAKIATASVTRLV